MFAATGTDQENVDAHWGQVFRKNPGDAPSSRVAGWKGSRPKRFILTQKRLTRHVFGAFLRPMQNDRKDTGMVQGRVADAPSENFVYRMLPAALWPYAQLARWDRPIGWQLLLWPCLWSATLAPQWAAPSAVHTGLPSFLHLLLFLVGAVAMRGAGCTYNDLVDHEIDNQVAVSYTHLTLPTICSV